MFYSNYQTLYNIIYNIFKLYVTRREIMVINYIKNIDSLQNGIYFL